VPSARRQSAEDRVMRRCFIQMERLRIELGSEGLDIVFLDDNSS
jgi:hypothetical protein